MRMEIESCRYCKILPNELSVYGQVLSAPAQAAAFSPVSACAAV